ncbi:MAG TPA: hypothetical protein VJW23_19995 [Propionibacteriaceae bacterium]|nr:hypothetical protein [Propionibacteriaceae bacterium]
MKVTITSAAPSTQGLRLGLRIEHEKAGWIRFATTVLVVKDLTYGERAYLTEALNRFEQELDDVDEPLFSDDSFI